MIADLKYFDGNLAKIDRMPAELRKLYATAFEVEPQWLVEAAARRQKWIDQSQSLNIYMAGASGKKLDETYKLAWMRGLKTTYYLRTMGATHAEKSTVQGRAAERGASEGGMLVRTRKAPSRPNRSSARSTTRNAKHASKLRREELEKMNMLNFEDEVAVSPIPGLAMQAVRGFMPASPATCRRPAASGSFGGCRRVAAHPRGGQAHHQRHAPTSTNWCRSSTNGPGRSISPPAPTTGCRRKSI